VDVVVVVVVVVVVRQARDAMDVVVVVVVVVKQAMPRMSSLSSLNKAAMVWMLSLLLDKLAMPWMLSSLNKAAMVWMATAAAVTVVGNVAIGWIIIVTPSLLTTAHNRLVLNLACFAFDLLTYVLSSYHILVCDNS